MNSPATLRLGSITTDYASCIALTRYLENESNEIRLEFIISIQLICHVYIVLQNNRQEVENQRCFITIAIFFQLN
jgi:hypothetical protein